MIKKIILIALISCCKLDGMDNYSSNAANKNFSSQPIGHEANTSDDLLIQANETHYNDYICNHCNYGTNSSRDFIKHDNTTKHLNNVNNWHLFKYTCLHCRFGTNNSDDFCGHKKKPHHKKRAQQSAFNEYKKITTAIHSIKNN